MKVFLGGTCNKSLWRDQLIPMLKIDYFNSVVSDWNEKAYERELFERANCNICLYVISPEMTGVYSIAEVTDDSNKRKFKTVFYINREDDFDPEVLKSLQAVGKMVLNNGAWWRGGSLQDLADFLNTFTGH